MLYVCPQVRLRVKTETFKLTERALPFPTNVRNLDEEITLGFKKSSLNISRIERLYVEAVQRSDAYWDNNYPKFLDEFRDRKQSAIFSNEESVLRVYNYEELNLQGYEDPRPHISFDWCDPNPHSYRNGSYPERFPRPVGEVNPDLARRYINFLRYRDSLLARSRHLSALFKAWIDDDVRNRYPRPYQSGFRQTVSYVINDRTYVLKISERNSAWIDVDHVISGLDKVKIISF